jgi:hypothetical protein
MFDNLRYTIKRLSDEKVIEFLHMCNIHVDREYVAHVPSQISHGGMSWSTSTTPMDIREALSNMGSILSKIRDDEDDYDHLCRKHGESRGELYGVHNSWLTKFDRGETNLSFEEYKLESEANDARRKIVALQNKILELEKERDENLKKVILGKNGG